LFLRKTSLEYFASRRVHWVNWISGIKTDFSLLLISKLISEFSLSLLHSSWLCVTIIICLHNYFAWARCFAMHSLNSSYQEVLNSMGYYPRFKYTWKCVSLVCDWIVLDSYRDWSSNSVSVSKTVTLRLCSMHLISLLDASNSAWACYARVEYAWKSLYCFSEKLRLSA